MFLILDVLKEWSNDVNVPGNCNCIRGRVWMSDPDILVSNEPWYKLYSHAYSWRKQYFFFKEIHCYVMKNGLFGNFFWSIFRSPVLTSVFLIIKRMIPLYFKHVSLKVDLVFALQLAIQWFYFGYGSCKWETKKHYRQVGCIESLTFQKNQIVGHFYDSHWYKKLFNTTFVSKFQIGIKCFFILCWKERVRKMTVKSESAKQR